MASFIQTAFEATTTFSATNVDDLFILMLFFSRLDQSFRAWHVVCGQFIGITVLVLVSLLSLLGRFAVPEGWIGVLGLFPISLGLSQLAETLDATSSASLTPGVAQTFRAQQWLAGIIAVTTLTIANGGDNISVYIAMLANSNSSRLQIFLFMFALLTGLWCLLAWWMTQSPGFTKPLLRLGREWAPILLVGIGIFVLIESQLWAYPSLALFCLLCLVVMASSLTLQLWRSLSSPRRHELPPP